MIHCIKALTVIYITVSLYSTACCHIHYCIAVQHCMLSYTLLYRCTALHAVVWIIAAQHCMLLYGLSLHSTACCYMDYRCTALYAVIWIIAAQHCMLLYGLSLHSIVCSTRSLLVSSDKASYNCVIISPCIT